MSHGQSLMPAAPNVHQRRITQGSTTELYLTLQPSSELSPKQAVAQLYEHLLALLDESSAMILCERLLVSEEVYEEAVAVRAEVMGDRVDEVPPTVLMPLVADVGPVHGLQVHAVAGDHLTLETIEHAGQPVGRRLADGQHTWIMLNNLGDPAAGDAAAQATAMFETSQEILKQQGSRFHDVARTWLWLDDINTWYDKLNDARSDFFKTCGLIDPATGKTLLPASTGIGIRPAGGRACAMDLIALIDGCDKIQRVEAGGEQDTAFAYGSAFSRASVAPMPAGPTVFISGTAAIDPQGRTEHVDDIEAQIAATLEHIRALFRQLDCPDDQALFALVYSKDAAVHDCWRKQFEETVPWPNIAVIGEVCRPDLLFEVEVAARPATD